MTTQGPETGELILVVDDAPPNVKLLRLILKDAGYRVAEANSGPEALAHLEQERPAAVILDVRMPGMSGYQVCEAIRRDARFLTLPVIMVTALSLTEERVKGIAAGATDFITKPFDKKELLARLASSLALVRAQGQGVVAQLPGALVVVAADWRVLALSPLAVRLLGLRPEQPLGTDLLRLLQARQVALPPTAPAREWTFEGVGEVPLRGRYTPVADPDGNLLVGLVALWERVP